MPVRLVRWYLARYSDANGHAAQSAGNHQLLVDVSVIIRSDAGTGIQRMVRAILDQLLQHPPAGYEVCPVYATRIQAYRHASCDFSSTRAEGRISDKDAPVNVANGDIFLGLDLAAHLAYRNQMQFWQWKKSGVRIHMVVYDLLPLRHPEWFNKKTSKHFRRWIPIVAKFSDQVFCLSQTVQADIRDWLESKYQIKSDDDLPIHVIQPGADIRASRPSAGIPDTATDLLKAIAGQPTVLMVGTLEPRKGHAQVLSAFEHLWATEQKMQLLIVGKPGWKTEALQTQLRQHPQNGKTLWWLDNASDALLEYLYRASSGVLLASYGEGYGLPLIEALHHGKPVLARDIPVFREVGESRASFFNAKGGADLAHAIQNWLPPPQADQHTPCQIQQSWHDCTQALVATMLDLDNKTMARKITDANHTPHAGISIESGNKPRKTS